MIWNPFLAGLIVLSCVSGCGSNYSISPCVEAYRIQMRQYIDLCPGVIERDDCWKCLCLCMSNEGEFVLAQNEHGLPDLASSRCKYIGSCEGPALDEALECLSNREACAANAPNMSWLFDDDVICGQEDPEFTSEDFCR